MLLAAGPSTADWMQAWGTVAGTAFAAGAFVVALQIGVAEGRSRRREEAERNAQQARLITCAVEGIPQDGSGLLEIRVTVSNHSDGPVFDVWMSVRQRIKGTERRLTLLQSEQIAPDTGWSESVRLGEPVPWPNRVLLGDEFHVDMGFTDAAGRRWKRLNYGQPVADARPI